MCWTILWLSWNLVGPARLRFDPAPAFVLWLFISNMIQICLMPLIMISSIGIQPVHDHLSQSSRSGPIRQGGVPGRQPGGVAAAPGPPTRA